VWFVAISGPYYKNRASITKVPSQTLPQLLVNALKCQTLPTFMKDVFHALEILVASLTPAP
jgi:hypothetical protein